MTHLWNVREICEATNGQCDANAHVSSVEIDSRKIEPGALFVALTTGTTDGHDYVASAMEAGASLALVSRYVDGVAKEKQILVNDTEKALQQLGVAARLRSEAMFFGVTGSVGKTHAPIAMEWLAATRRSSLDSRDNPEVKTLSLGRGCRANHAWDSTSFGGLATGR